MEVYTDFQGREFRARETVTICWHVANSGRSTEGDFRVMPNGGSDVVLGRLFLEANGAKSKGRPNSGQSLCETRHSAQQPKLNRIGCKELF